MLYKKGGAEKEKRVMILWMEIEEKKETFVINKKVFFTRSIKV